MHSFLIHIRKKKRRYEPERFLFGEIPPERAPDTYKHLSPSMKFFKAMWRNGKTFEIGNWVSIRSQDPVYGVIRYFFQMNSVDYVVITEVIPTSPPPFDLKNFVFSEDRYFEANCICSRFNLKYTY